MLRACGDVNYPMIVIILSIALNIVLNPFFMFDFGLGLKVQGAAVATVLAQGISVVLCVIYIFKKTQLLIPEKEHFAYDKCRRRCKWR